MVSLFPFTPLSPVKDTVQQLKRHILWLLIIRIFLYSLLIAITVFLKNAGHSSLVPPGFATVFFLGFLSCFSIFSAYLLNHLKISVRKFGVIQLLADTVFTAILVYATGCSQSIFTPVFILPVIAGGLILYRIGGLIAASASTLLYGGVLACEYLAILPPYLQATSYRIQHDPLIGINLFAFYGLIFFLAAILSGLLAGKLRSTEEKLTKTTLEYDRLAILYKQIFDDISTGIITTDDHNFITSYNKAAERITGFPIQNVLGQPFQIHFPEIQLEGALVGRSVCDLHRFDGAPIRVGYSYSNMHMPLAGVEEPEQEQEHALWKVITLQDISQIERMEKQMIEAEKMVVIGQLSASIAHDFRNPLAAISGSAQILSMEHAEKNMVDPDTLKALMDIILRESNRMATTITDFLQFARPAEIQAEWFDLNRLVDEVIAVERTKIEQQPGVKVSKDIPMNLSCWGDRQQVHTVLKQLLENGLAALPQEGGKIMIQAEEKRRGKEHYIQIAVKDTGPGIPTDLKQKVFTPFFSTRENSTGLGLAISKQIVENHGGSIKILADKNCNSIICINIPIPVQE